MILTGLHYFYDQNEFIILFPSLDSYIMKPIKYFTRVVYGFVNKLEIVVLGELKSGKVKEGMYVRVILHSGSVLGSWKITEVLNTDFINQFESPDFMGLVLKCSDIKDFELLKSLRVYDEIITIVDNN